MRARPAPETSSAGAATIGIVRRDGDRARSVDGDPEHGAGRGAHLRGPDRGGARLARAEPVAVASRVGLEALNLPLLLGFVTGLRARRASRGCGADWSRLAVAAGATLSAVFALSAVLWIGVVLSAGELAEPSPAFELVWQLHAAAFALALPALGTTFIGAALAAHTSRLTPPGSVCSAWPGEACCSPPGRPASRSRTARRSCSWASLAAWLVWLLATGVRLVRARTADRPDNASTYDEE